MAQTKRAKQKAVEVLSLHCLDREPRPGAKDNRWVVVVKVEIRGPVYQHPIRHAQRTVTVIAPDEIAAYTKVLTEGV